MNDSSAVLASDTRYELRFSSLFDRGRGFTFPCDAQGRVSTDRLSERGRASYRVACAAVGSELSAPVVSPLR